LNRYQLGGDDDDGRRAVADLFVLKLRQLDENLGPMLAFCEN
jgi:hypothetical protein